MARPSDVHEELSALRAELRRASEPERGRTSSLEDAPWIEDSRKSAPMSALEEQLDELGKVLSEYSDTAEDIVAKYPLIAVGAAFALGIALGRLLGRA